MSQQKGEVQGTSPYFETSLATASVDYLQNNMKVKDDRTLVSKIHRSTDKVSLRNHPYSKTFSKRRVTKTAYKEINLRVGYSKHSQ